MAAMSKEKRNLILYTVLILAAVAFRFVLLPTLRDRSAEETTISMTEEEWESRIEELQESMDARDLSEIPHTVTLTTGNYWVLFDIPAGYCTISWADGHGKIYVDAYDRSFSAEMGDPEQFPDVKNTFSSVRMTFGNVHIEGPLTVTLEYSNVSADHVPIISLSEFEIELPAGEYTLDDIGGAVGLPAEIISFNNDNDPLTKNNYFDLTAVSGAGEVWTSDFAVDGIHEHMSASPGEEEISTFHRLWFLDTYTLTITGDLVLRLTPYTYDSP